MIAIEDLKNLATISGPCLTILEPVRDPVSQVTKADTRLVAAAQKAEEMLEKKGFSQGDRERFLAPVRNFAVNTEWAGRGGSVAIFRAPGFTQATFWPDTLAPEVRLGDQFMVLPLLTGLAAERNYWVLALSINRIHLFRGKGREFTEVELPESLPRSLADFTGLDKPDHDLEARSAKGPSSGAAGGVHFGTTNVPESEAAHLHDYFKTIDRAIHPIMGRNGGDPLVLAAVPRELALYRTVNAYTPLAEESIHGSPDALGHERLHKDALEVVAAHTLTAMDKIRKEMDVAAGRRLLLTDPAEVLAAARLGKVARFFINREATEGGTKALENEEVINSAALAVIHNSGTVVCCEGQVAPDQVAAILRYRTEDENTPSAELATTTAR
jgi:hypothetical protein